VDEKIDELHLTNGGKKGDAVLLGITFVVLVTLLIWIRSLLGESWDTIRQDSDQLEILNRTTPIVLMLIPLLVFYLRLRPKKISLTNDGVEISLGKRFHRRLSWDQIASVDYSGNILKPSRIYIETIPVTKRIRLARTVHFTGDQFGRILHHLESRETVIQKPSSHPARLFLILSFNGFLIFMAFWKYYQSRGP